MAERARRAAEPTGFLYPFIEAEERDAGALMTDLVASARGQGRRERLPARRHADSLRRRGGGRRVGHGGPVPAGRPPVHLRQRRQRDRRAGHGGAVPAAPLTAGRCPPSPSSRTRPSSPRSPTTSGFELVFSRQLIAHAKRGRHRRRLLHQRRLAEPAARLRGGGAARAPHGRPVRLRGLRHGDERRRPALPGRALRERAPDPGDPGRADVRPLAGRAAPPGPRQPAAGAGMTDTAPDQAAGTRQRPRQR